jgi:hypothetical protein
MDINLGFLDPKFMFIFVVIPNIEMRLKKMFIKIL